MNKESRNLRVEERKRIYYSLDSDLLGVQDKMISIRRNRGHSPAFKMLLIAIQLMRDQVQKDHARYERRIRRIDDREVSKFLQNSLNREKEKNAILEKKIEEAKTSSGLFIDFVREKLNFK